MSKQKRSKEKKFVVHLEGETEKYVSRYLKDIQKDRVRCMHWIRKKDFEKIEKFAHTLKGSGGAMGLERLSEFGRALEKAVRRKSLSAIKKWAGKISYYLDSLEVNYK